MLRKTMLATLSALATMSAVASADDLSIGMRIEAVIDPHYFFSGNNIQYYRHYLGFLTTIDPSGEVVPAMAESWEALDTGWIFKLRPGLEFSDGSDLTTEDVIASFERARDYPQAAGPYAGLFNGVSELKAVDDLTLEIVMDAFNPTMPFTMTQIAIIPSEVAATASQEDFMTAKGSVSSGPFKFVSYTSGQSLVLERNENYWGEPSEWDTVTFRFYPDPAARVAALIAGDVDMINGVSPEFVDRIRNDGRFAVHTAPSMRNVFIELDQFHDKSPFVTDLAGKPLDVNPLKDKRVRQAISHAINREALNERVMNGLSFPSGQLVGEGIGGYNPEIAVPAYDPELSKRLLEEAGWGEGFGITLHCTNDRYVNDAKICQALGQMFTRIGVKTSVVTMPSSAYWALVPPTAGDGASVMLGSWSAAASGEADVLDSVFRTFDNEKRTGLWNLGRYSNPELDRLLSAFRSVRDDSERLGIQREAMALAMEDVAAIPLHDEAVVVATKKEIAYTPHIEDATTATSASRVE